MKKTVLAFVLACFAVLNANAQYYENTKMKVGQKAPELAYQDPQGKTLKLSEINKGTYVLLDFWASWCGPCRMSNPGLVRMYDEFSTKKFKDAKKGFTIVSFSIDMKKQAWTAAIQQDGLKWPYHMSDLNTQGQWASAACPTYGLEYIPQAFLLDPQGNIIGKYNRAEEARADIEKFVKK